MAGKLSTITPGISTSTPILEERAVAKISINGRSRTALGSVGLITDVVLFPSWTGMWLVPNQRVRVANVPVIDKSSTGQAYLTALPGVTVPMFVAQADPRTKAG